MNKSLILTICIFLFTFSLSCSQPPNFVNPVTVRQKKTNEYGSTYFLEADNGMWGSGWGTVKFRAPESFAKEGDIIIFENGVLKIK